MATKIGSHNLFMQTTKATSIFNLIYKKHTTFALENHS